MNQTPVQKAIEHVENKLKEANETMKSGVNEGVKVILRYDIATLNKIVLHLYSLLPYEREVIGAAYVQGEIDFSSEASRGVAHRDHADKTDYFTKTYSN
jgi:hypothetical protein